MRKAETLKASRQQAQRLVDVALASLAQETGAAGGDAVDGVKCFVIPPSLWCEGEPESSA